MVQEAVLEEKPELVARTEREIYLRRRHPDTCLKIRGKPWGEIEYRVGSREWGRKEDPGIHTQDPCRQRAFPEGIVSNPSFSQQRILCIIKYTSPPDKKAKHIFFSIGHRYPSFHRNFA